MVDQRRLGLETLKLLIEVAWADREVAEEEAQYVMTLAQQVGADEGDVRELERCLRDDKRLPAPSFPLLRQAPDEVLRQIDSLIAVDDRIVKDEALVRREIERMLRGE